MRKRQNFIITKLLSNLGPPSYHRSAISGEYMFENYKVPKELIPSDPRFGVGPSLIPIETLDKLRNTGHELLGTSHRKPAVRKVVEEFQSGLRAYFNLPSDYEIVLGNGGATFLWDMMGLGLVENNSLHTICGEFSDKWYKAHSLIPWIKTKKIEVEYGKGINPQIESGFDFIAGTLNETSTGVQITDVPQVDAQTLMAIDATSGAGQIELDFKKVDVYYFSPQKVFASEGGLYVAIMSPKAIERAQRLAKTNRYIPEVMKWTNAIDNSRQNQTYNTPAITTIFFMNEQLKLMNKLGEKEVIKQAQAKAKAVYEWAESKSYLSPFIKETQFRSQAVATIDVDDRFKVDDLAKVLRDQKVAYDIESYRKLNRNQLRIALFHNVELENLEKLMKIISSAIESN